MALGLGKRLAATVMFSVLVMAFAARADLVTGELSQDGTKLTVIVPESVPATFDPLLLNANLATVTELVKDGPGTLDVPANAGFSSYAGAITVKAGKYVYHDNTGFGNTDNQCGDITDEAGGALVAQQDVKSVDFSLRYRKVKLAGIGPDESGAWQFYLLESRNAMGYSLNLDGDALISLMSGDIFQTGITDLAPYAIFNLNGHELKVDLHGRQLTLSRPQVTGGGGRLVLTSSVDTGCVLKLQNYSSSSFLGVDDTDLTVTPEGKTSVLLIGGDQKLRAKLQPTADNVAAVSVGSRFNGNVNTNYHNWVGAIDFGTSRQRLALQPYDAVTVEGVNYYHNTLTLGGKISGSGPIYVYPTSTKLTERHFHLTNAENDFTGGLAVDKLTAFLWANGAVPANGGDLTLTNATLKLQGGGYYALPTVRADGDCTIDGKVGSAPTIVKTGDGVLTLNGAYATEQLEVQGGTVKLPAKTVADRSYYAGLCEGVGYYTSSTLSQSTDLKAGYAYRQGVSTNLPRLVTSYTDSFRRPADQTWVTERGIQRYLITYSGYIWNNSEETVRWTFAANLGNATVVRFDDVQLFWMYNTSETLWATVEATPGPHRIYIGNEGKINDGGAQKSAKNMDPNWDNMGVQWDPQGRDSNVKANYQRLQDPGDGSLLTWCLPGEATDYPVADTYVLNREAEKPGKPTGKVGGIRSMKFAGGTSLDASGTEVAVKDLYGTPAVTDCPLLTISNSWTVCGADLVAGHKLTVSKLLLDNNPQLLVDGGNVLKLNREYAIATVTGDEGLIGWPETEIGEYDVVYDDSTKTLKIKRIRGDGMLIILK